MTTIKQTFDPDNETGKTIGKVIELFIANGLSDGEILAVTQWLYVNYRVSKDIEVIPDPTP